MSKPVLKLDWCSHEAAKYAVEHWHYSRQLPPFPHARLGVWEGDDFVGCVLFSRGANCNMAKTYTLASTEAAELTRVALRAHKNPVSRVVTVAVRLLSREFSRLRLLVSYADPYHGHHGGIYQACGWLYVGSTQPDFGCVDHAGRWWHSRLLSESGLTTAFGKKRRVPRPSECKRIDLPGKHKYLMPLDAEMRARIVPLARPYPKRATGVDSDAPANHAGQGGASPTVALSPPSGDS